MANVIFKYPLRETDVQEVAMPQCSRLLSVGQQDGVPVLWALVNTDFPQTERRIRIIGTGNRISSVLGPFIGTVQMDSGPVWHLFDQGESPT